MILRQVCGCRLVEESPKWLMASGRLERAQRVTAAICSRNGLSPATLAETHPMAEKLQTQVPTGIHSLMSQLLWLEIPSL